MQTLARRGVGDAAAGLGLHFLHMSEGTFSHDAGHICITSHLENLSAQRRRAVARTHITEFDILRACGSMYEPTISKPADKQSIVILEEM